VSSPGYFSILDHACPRPAFSGGGRSETCRNLRFVRGFERWRYIYTVYIVMTRTGGTTAQLLLIRIVAPILKSDFGLSYDRYLGS
jgi:hypothetical protein